MTTVNMGGHGSFHINKGALHRALGVPEGQNIPANKMAGARNSSNPHVRRMAASAAGLAGMHHGGSRSRTTKTGSKLFKE